MKQVEWTGIRMLVDQMYKEGLVRKTFHDDYTDAIPGELPAIIYEFEARVIDPDIIAPTC